MLALIKDGAVISVVSEGAGFPVGNAWAMPAYDGWENDDGYSLVTVLEADPIPEGKIVASCSVEMVGGAPKFVNQLGDYVASVPEEISDRQFFQGLAGRGMITEAEALAAVKTGDIPEAMASLVQALPEESRFPAEMLLSGATIFKRSHPLTTTLGAAFGWDALEIDQFWCDAAML